ncbi:MAG: M50 family metallopeptidase [Candidatus Kapaibacteriota bacterium]
MAKINDNQRKAILLLLITIVNVSLFQFELGRQLLYPFTILGTWFHEMSHGLMAMLNGGNFEKLEIFSDGSGVATSSGELFFGRISRALVALAGPLGPTAFGYLFFRIAKNEKAINYGLWFLSLLMILSLFIWIRSIYGLVVIGAMSGLILYVSFQANKTLKEGTVLFLGLQACISVYLSLGYILTEEVAIGNQVMKSDTGVVEEMLFLPHYIWGIVIIFISIYVIFDSLIRLFRK